MKIHRITSCGNSTAVTLAQDELDHLIADRGDLVTITKSAKNRLIIRIHQNDYFNQLPPTPKPLK